LQKNEAKAKDEKQKVKNELSLNCKNTQSSLYI